MELHRSHFLLGIEIGARQLSGSTFYTMDKGELAQFAQPGDTFDLLRDIPQEWEADYLPAGRYKCVSRGNPTNMAVYVRV